MAPWLGVVADDITGASDVAGRMAAEGISTTQLFGIPPDDFPIPDGSESIVIALKTRSIPAPEAVRQTLDATRWLEERGVEHVYVKYCSTFDSTDAGNIGPVCEAVAHHRNAQIVLVAPSAPVIGRTVYQGHLFVGSVMLSRSPLRHHPINPMRESDLRIVLARQTRARVEHLPYQVVQAGPAAIAREASRWLADGPAPVLVVADAISEADLDTLARFALTQSMSTGSAGLAASLARCRTNATGPRYGSFQIPDGPYAVVSGSCSEATRRQVEAYLAEHPGFLIDPRRVAAGEDILSELAAFLDQTVGTRGPIVYSTADPTVVGEIQRELGAERAAEIVETTLATAARMLVDRGVRRLMVAGGETSGSVAAALGVVGVQIGPEIVPGVPWTVTIGPTPLGLVFKSGNFGGPTLFHEIEAAGGRSDSPSE